MVWEWIRFFVVAGLLLVGMFFEVLAVFGVQKFKKALNRMHAAAMGDTLGVLFIFLGLIVMRGLSMDSLKLFLVILFFWLASPVSGHMISRLEAMTNPNLGEIGVIRLGERKGNAGGTETDGTAALEKETGESAAPSKETGESAAPSKETGESAAPGKETGESAAPEKGIEESAPSEKESPESADRKGGCGE